MLSFYSSLILFLLITLAMTVTSVLFVRKLFRYEGLSFRFLFKDFRQKMWMTIGLGVIFFGFYLVIVIVSSRLSHSGAWVDLFFLVYKDPLEFIYWGLFTFAGISLLIYLARMVVKYLFIKKGKGL